MLSYVMSVFAIDRKPRAIVGIEMESIFAIRGNDKQSFVDEAECFIAGARADIEELLRQFAFVFVFELREVGQLLPERCDTGSDK